VPYVQSFSDELLAASSDVTLHIASPVTELGDGEWGDLYDMKLIPIHAILLPDGNVLSYGTDNAGKQGGGLYYQIWNPAKGTTKRAHKLLEHSTGVRNTLSMYLLRC